MDQEKEKFMETFQQLSDYSQSILLAQVQIALVAENAIKRRYGLNPPTQAQGAQAGAGKAAGA